MLPQRTFPSPKGEGFTDPLAGTLKFICRPEITLIVFFATSNAAMVSQATTSERRLYLPFENVNLSPSWRIREAEPLATPT